MALILRNHRALAYSHLAVIQDYALGNQLGSGAFATVFEAKNLHTVEAVAVKRIDRDWLSYVRSDLLLPCIAASDFSMLP